LSGGGKMIQLSQGSKGISHGHDAGGVSVYVRQKTKTHDVRLVPRVPQQLAGDVGQVQEHAAAGASGQAADDVDARPKTANAKASPPSDRCQPLRIGTSGQFVAQFSRDEGVIVAKCQAAERSDAPRPQGPRDAIKHLRIEPSVDCGPGIAAVAWLE